MKRRLLFLFVLLTLLSGLMVTLTNVAHAETRVSHISSSCINPSGTTTLQGTLVPLRLQKPQHSLLPLWHFYWRMQET